VNGFSRRIFLRGAGGAALALPFLDSLATREARAEIGRTKRLIVLKTYSTQIIKDWYPTLASGGYQLKNAKYSGSKADGTTLLTKPIVSGLPYTFAPMTDFAANGLSNILGKALSPLLAKMSLIRGLDFLPDTNHNYGALLGNYSSSDEATRTPNGADSLPDWVTIDQVLAYSKKFYPTPPAVRSLHVTQGIPNTMSYTDLGIAGGAISQIRAKTNPLDAFNDCFGSFMGADPAKPNPDVALMDQVREQYLKLKSNPRLSADDKRLLDQYTTLIAELQNKLKGGASASCTKPGAPTSMPDNQDLNTTDIRTKWDLFIDTIVAAIMCDRTRIVTIDVHKALGPGPDPNNAALFGHYHNPNANGGSWHALAHDWGNANARRQLRGINAWVAEQVFYKLISKLDVPEADGRTYLDNSLVYWGNELGFNHINYSVPCILAGSAGGAITPGRYIDYIDWEQRAYFSQEDGNVIRGLPHNRFLVSVLQAMGLSPADYEKPGRPGYGETRTAGKDPNLWPVDYDFSKIGEPLPGLAASS
jgi:hypothetical protein